VSQSPQNAAEESGRENYLGAFGELAVKIRAGASFSGRERNCAFSNRGNGSFTDVSGLTGFNFPEDGRGLALTDWDHDGDVDVWVSNRTAPRLRFLQNKIPSADAQWVSFRLEGDPAKSVPRDGIGASIQLELKGGGKRVKTLHAGEGFMSQSSKWIHFGLGKGAEIERVRVHWRNGDFEEFEGVALRGRWHLKQGAGTAQEGDLRKTVSFEENPLIGRKESRLIRIALSQPLKIPDLVYLDSGKQERTVNELAEAGVVLVNLWNACELCENELGMFVEKAEQLKRAGVEILALNTDSFQALRSTGGLEPKALLKEIGFSGLSGIATKDLMNLLDSSISKSVYNHRGTPVPTSFLIDRGGWLSIVYKGPVDLEILLDDVSKLGKGPEISRASAVPFPGRWADKVFVTNPISNAVIYLEGQYFDDARGLLEDYLKENGSPPVQAQDAKTHTQNRQQAEAYYVLGEVERLSGAPAKAIAHYEKSLQYHSRQVLVLNQIAWVCATNADPKVRNGAKAVTYAEFMMRAPKVAENAGLLGTVAAAYASAGRFSDAIKVTRQAITLLTGSAQSDPLKVQMERLRRYEKSEALTE